MIYYYNGEIHIEYTELQRLTHTHTRVCAHVYTYINTNVHTLIMSYYGQ